MPPTLLVYLACVLMTVGALLFLEVLVPHLPGRPSRPPLGILAKGVVDGSLVGIAAVGLILVYRSSRIINFAHAALGAIAGALVFQLGTSYDLPFLAVLPVGIVAAIGAGALAELMLRRFFRAPRLVVTISTIALAPLVTRAIQTIIQALNPVPPGQSAAQATLKTLATPFPGFHLRLPDSPLAFGFSDVTSLAGSLLLMALVMLFLSRTRLGRAVRASAENPEAAWLLGINIRVATTIVWALAALLSGFASLVAVAGSGINTQGADAGAAQ
jgi:branched-chain amino acid transport system permease protein